MAGSDFTDGEFRKHVGGTLDVRDEAPGESFATAGLAGPEYVDAAVGEFTGRRWLTVHTEPAHYPY